MSANEAQNRLKALAQSRKEPSRFRRIARLFIKQFANPLVLLLLVAVMLSGIMGETTDMVFILCILLATGLLSFFQELHAGNAVEKLRQMLTTQVLALRGDEETPVNTQEIVPGDILLLKAGDIIPADCRILQCDHLHVNESALTGESFPAEKQEGEVPDTASLAEKVNCLWKGTHVVSGTAKALAVNVGDQTIFGQLKHSLEHDSETVFEKGLKDFGIFLLKITVFLSVFILGANLFFHKPLADSILFSLAIAVGMAPELLPAIMTLAMTAGANRMLKKKVIVKKLSSIINFGEMQVLCTDKTGTLTEGVTKVSQMVNVRGENNPYLYELAKANAVLQKGFSNPIDETLAKLDADVSGYHKQGEIPYDFVRRRLSILARKGDETLIITKGATTNILEICTRFSDGDGIRIIGDAERETITNQFEKYGRIGFRVLALATKQVNQDRFGKDDETGMTFMGFILLEDPLKEGVVESVNRLRELNTRLKIITGDNRYVAAYTAQKVGLNPSKIMTGSDMANMTPEALKVKVRNMEVFAEIEPQQKEMIILSLQKSGLAVAYLGDGINDAAAIHAADTGISVNDAVDVAKEAADFVLLEKDLSVLADGIIEGRKTFANSLKYIFISTGATFGNMFSVALSSLLLPFLPMLPKQILLTNFLTDFPYLAISNDNVDAERLKKPGRWNLSLIRKFMVVFGLHSSLFDFITFYFLFFYLHTGEAGFQTGWFLESVVTELLILFIVRSAKPVFKSRPSRVLLLAVAGMTLITLACIYITPIAALLQLEPLAWFPMAGIAAILLAYLITGDLLKLLFFRWVKE